MKTKVLIIGIVGIILSLALSITSLSLVLINLSKSDENIFNQNINKVVEIRVSSDNTVFAYGTGCFISSSGEILTNKHMVYNQTLDCDYQTIQVRLPLEENFVDAEILKISEDSDLAIIKIDKNNTQFFQIGKNVENGQEIYTIGNPSGFGLSFLKGNVSSKLRNIVYNDVLAQVMQTSLVVNEGNSGGPVFDRNGNLVGLISFRLKDKNHETIQGVSFAVPINKINDFLQNNWIIKTI